MNKNLNSDADDRLLNYSLKNIIANYPGISHVKDASNYQYILTNTNNLAVYGFLSEKELIGKTVFDLNNTVMKNKWESGFAEYIHKQDRLVVDTGKPIKIPGKIFLNNDGFVVIHSMVKFPIFNVDRKVEAIMTFSFDSTQTENVEVLYKYYKDCYEDEEQANRKFLEYTGFMKGYWDKITTREIECLIALAKSRDMKGALRLLGEMKEGTLKSHIEKLKLKTGIPNKQTMINLFISKCPCKILT